MTLFVACHAIGASLALLLGGVNVVRRPKGDRVHKIVGRVWVVAMYWTLISSMFIQQLNPGHFTIFHVLTVFTFCTLTIGLWAAMTGRIEQHRGFMRGSWFGVVGAFIGAVAVPDRDIPQLAVHDPVALTLSALAVIAASAGIVWLAHRRAHVTERSGAPRIARTRTFAA